LYSSKQKLKETKTRIVQQKKFFTKIAPKVKKGLHQIKKSGYFKLEPPLLFSSFLQHEKSSFSLLF
jgi:hypothetical protein